jgi:hypothetical protein
MEIQNLLNNIKSIDETVGAEHSLFKQKEAERIAKQLNDNNPQGWEDWSYEAVWGYSGPGYGTIGTHKIKVIDYRDGGYIVGYL